MRDRGIVPPWAEEGRQARTRHVLRDSVLSALPAAVGDKERVALWLSLCLQLKDSV